MIITRIVTVWALLLLPVGAYAEDLRSLCLSSLGGRSGEIVVVDIESGRKLAAVRKGCGGSHPPGSVSKLVCAYAGLATGAIQPGATFACRNAVKLKGKIYHCTLKGGHGELDLERAIAQSCNIWFYQAAQRVGSETILRTWGKLGGVKPDRLQKAVSAPRLAVGEEGPKATALQMATLARSIAVGGNDPKSPCLILRHSMRKAVTDGTAKGLAGCRVQVCAKTGSPQHIGNPDKRHGWLVGFAPADKPKIAFAVFCLEGNSYKSAVPVARKLIDGFFVKRR